MTAVRNKKKSLANDDWDIFKLLAQWVYAHQTFPSRDDNYPEFRNLHWLNSTVHLGNVFPFPSELGRTVLDWGRLFLEAL